jgi:hypothetical protein
MKLNTQALGNIRFAKNANDTSNWNRIEADLLNHDREHKVVIYRQASGWDVDLVVEIDGTTAHCDKANAEDRAAWDYLTEQANHHLYLLDSARAQDRARACRLLFTK